MLTSFALRTKPRRLLCFDQKINKKCIMLRPPTPARFPHYSPTRELDEKKQNHDVFVFSKLFLILPPHNILARTRPNNTISTLTKCENYTVASSSRDSYAASGRSNVRSLLPFRTIPLFIAKFDTGRPSCRTGPNFSEVTRP